MSKKKVVVALGHKALGTTFPEQKTAVKAAAIKKVRLFISKTSN